MALVPPFFLDCVVAVGTRRKAADDVTWSASGFLYGDFVRAFEETEEFQVYLVTNRHVFSDNEEAAIRMNPMEAEPAREFRLRLREENGEVSWLEHPDENIDVAVMPIDVSILDERAIRYNIFRSHQHVLDREGALRLGLSEGDGVYVLGFPLGLIGGDRNYVIVREGSIARIRDWLAGSANEFLADVPVFPGNSGGPVVSRPETTAIRGTKSQKASYLIGLVQGYVSFSDVAVSQQTGATRIIFEENSGLASVVPIDFVMQVVEQHRKSEALPPSSEQTAVAPEEPAAGVLGDAPPRRKGKGSGAKAKGRPSS